MFNKFDFFFLIFEEFLKISKNSSIKDKFLLFINELPINFYDSNQTIPNGEKKIVMTKDNETTILLSIYTQLHSIDYNRYLHDSINKFQKEKKFIKFLCFSFKAQNFISELIVFLLMKLIQKNIKNSSISVPLLYENFKKEYKNVIQSKNCLVTIKYKDNIDEDNIIFNNLDLDKYPRQEYVVIDLTNKTNKQIKSAKT